MMEKSKKIEKNIYVRPFEKKQTPIETSISYFLKHPPKQVVHIF
jgi:hypothetical protein